MVHAGAVYGGQVFKYAKPLIKEASGGVHDNWGWQYIFMDDGHGELIRWSDIKARVEHRRAAAAAAAGST